MTRHGLLARLGLSWSLAALLLALARPPSVGAPWPLGLAVGMGLLAGGALYAALARRRPRPPYLRPAVGLVLVVGAGAEEVVWRWFALSELASRAGVALALVVTSLAFAALHRNRSLGHALAGGVFGAVYVAGGTVVSAWAAHAAYNLLVAGSARGRPPPLSYSDTGAGRVSE